MRILEILLLAALLPGVTLLFLTTRRRPRWRLYLPGLGVVLIVLHLLIEGYRWQMVPAYALTGISLLASLRALTHRVPPPPPPSRWRRALAIAGAVGALIVFGLTALVPVLLPVFELPKPSGDLRVGTTRFSLMDSSRPETFTADPSDTRELLIQAWYPAEPSADSVPEGFWGQPKEIARLMTRGLRLPPFLFDHFTLIKTYSHRDAVLARVKPSYPVLVFSHGYNQGIPPQNTVQMEELASHGYVVFSIGHSYESLALVHPDGRTVAVSEEQMQRVRDQSRGAGPLIRKLIASQDAAERADLLRQVAEAGSVFNESVAIWVEDTRFVLDELARLDGRKEPRGFAGRLDLTRVGVFGMSFGGTVATDVCLTDSRCRAGINLDGLQYGLAASPAAALEAPFMFMTNESAGLMNEPVFRRAQGDAWYVTVKGSTHFNYTDFSLISPLFSKLGMLGPIEGRRMEQILNAYVRAFFDQHLAGQDSVLLKGASSDYPEVTLQSRVGTAHDETPSLGSPSVIQTRR